MIVSNKKDVQEIKLEGAPIKGAYKKVLISPNEGWEGYVMRLFRLSAGGYSPKHAHPWPHINYMVAGKGVLYLDGKEYEVEAGSFAYVPSDKEHQFRNAGEEDFEFICIVPEEGDK